MFNHQRLICYEFAMSLAKRVPHLISSWPTGSGYLVDQLKRAMASIPLNIAEGAGRSGTRDRARFFAIARGSAMEVSAIIDIAQAYEMVDQDTYTDIQDKLLQIVKILYKLS